MVTTLAASPPTARSVNSNADTATTMGLSMRPGRAAAGAGVSGGAGNDPNAARQHVCHQTHSLTKARRYCLPKGSVAHSCASNGPG